MQILLKLGNEWDKKLCSISPNAIYLQQQVQKSLQLLDIYFTTAKLTSSCFLTASCKNSLRNGIVQNDLSHFCKVQNMGCSNGTPLSRTTNVDNSNIIEICRVILKIYQKLISLYFSLTNYWYIDIHYLYYNILTKGWRKVFISFLPFQTG